MPPVVGPLCGDRLLKTTSETVEKVDTLGTVKSAPLLETAMGNEEPDDGLLHVISVSDTKVPFAAGRSPNLHKVKLVNPEP